MTKLNINIHEAKTQLSKYVRYVQAGRLLTLCRNGQPVAQIVPVVKKSSAWKYFGVARELIGEIPDDFDDELTANQLPGFEP